MHTEKAGVTISDRIKYEPYIFIRSFSAVIYFGRFIVLQANGKKAQPRYEGPAKSCDTD